MTLASRDLLWVLLIAALGCGETTSMALTPKDKAPEPSSSSALELKATDHLGRPFDLAVSTSDATTIVIFYRGHW